MERAIISCGMGSLWMIRNKWKHGETTVPIQQPIFLVRDTAFDLWQILHPEKIQREAEVVKRWQAPADSWIKCNADGAFFQDWGRGATGVVLRDHNGAYMAGQALYYGQCLDALTTEAMACRDGLVLAMREGCFSGAP